MLDWTFTWQTVSWSLNVQVTATVLPVLNMEISTWSILLWELNTSWSWDIINFNIGSLTITWATNALNGMNIVMGSSWLSYSGQYIWSWSWISGTATTDLDDSYKYSTWTLQTSSNEISSTNNIFNTAVPVAPTATTVTIWAVAWITTPAWNYSDTLVFTVTWNF
jgi:hypothetical protein